MAKVGDYRIRWAIVSYGNGYRLSRERMCLAERRYWLCWFPMQGSEWRFEEGQALRDIERDRMLRAPLPAAKVI